mgnify:CR=1 FL=1
MNFCPNCATALAEVAINEESRHACPSSACDFVHWDNPTPVVAMIVEVDGGVVMAHNVAWPDTFYSIITGFLEAGEDPCECAIRETKEELGLTADRTELVGVYGFAEQNQVIIAYHVMAAGEIVLNEELDAYKIVAPADIQPWPMGTGLALSDWLSRSKK